MSDLRPTGNMLEDNWYMTPQPANGEPLEWLTASNWHRIFPLGDWSALLDIINTLLTHKLRTDPAFRERLRRELNNVQEDI